jgi:hypothetical protein
MYQPLKAQQLKIKPAASKAIEETTGKQCHFNFKSLNLCDLVSCYI